MLTSVLNRFTQLFAKNRSRVSALYRWPVGARYFAEVARRALKAV